MKMSNLDHNQYAMLELLAIRPLSCIPPLHMSFVDELSKRGLTVRRGRHWYPTADALKLMGCTIH
jgi:hypothetical protein